MPQPPRQHVVLNNGDPASVAVFLAKPFEDPLRGMPLFLRPTLILRQDNVDDPGERTQLRARRRPAPPVTRRNRKRQHLGHRPRVDPKLTRRFTPAQTFNLNRKTNLSIELHALHPPAPAASDKGHLLPDFYSSATGCSGRFSREGFSLRRLHNAEGAEIAEQVQDLDGSCWSADNAAGCGACGYEGAVRDFSALPAGVVSL